MASSQIYLNGKWKSSEQTLSVTNPATGEKISEVFLGPMMGGGIEIWFAYVLALLFLLVRPQGLFGERIIERV